MEGMNQYAGDPGSLGNAYMGEEGMEEYQRGEGQFDNH